MSQFATFDQRLQRLARKHARIQANGYVGRLTDDGLVVMVPRRRGPSFPLRGLIGVSVVALLFKAYLLAALGGDDYAARVAALEVGSPIEQAGAWVMATDPATRFAAELLARVI